MPAPPFKNLNLFTICFPLPAIVSILHRISGLILFLLIPFLLWALQWSLTADGFDYLQQALLDNRVKFLVWLFLVPLVYHFVAGMRHLLSDVHIGNSRRGGKIGASIVFVMVFMIMLLIGIMLW